MGLSFGSSARFCIRSIRRRSVLSVFLALLIPSASIAAPLMMGASFQSSLRDDIYRSLGEIDIIVRSSGMMRPAVFDAVAGDSGLRDLTDAMAPAIILSGTAEGPGGKRDPNVEFIGITGAFSALGKFSDISKGTLSARPGPGQAYIPSGLASKIGAGEGDALKFKMNDPTYSLESIYTPGASIVSGQLQTGAVLKADGPGILRLFPRGAPKSTVFVDCEWLQNVTGKRGYNALLISNRGDTYTGAELSTKTASRLKAVLDSTVGHQEGGFTVSAANEYVKLENDRIFFPEKFSSLVRGLSSDISAVSAQTSYFANQIINGEKWIAYSTVTAVDTGADAVFGKFTENETGFFISADISGSEMIVTDYTAGRLNLSVGDTVTLNYTVYDRAFAQQLVYENFTVKHIVDLEGKADDPALMPPFPGISGKNSCGDWTPPIPINYQIMSPDDLTYWRMHGGAPKAYIGLEAGKRLWGNDLGNLTTVKALPGPGVSVDRLASEISEGLNSSLTAVELGVTIDTVKQSSLQSVSGLDIVTESLLAFGMAVTFSGMVIITVVVHTSIESRKRELGILRSLGLTRKGITRLVTFEGIILSAGASGFGTAAGVLFAAIGVWASNNLWTAILPVEASLHWPDALSAVGSYIGGFVCSVIAYAGGARRASKGNVIAVLRNIPEEGPVPRPGGGPALAAACATAFALVMAAGLFLADATGEYVLLFYFLAGDGLLLLTGYFIYRNIGQISRALSGKSRIGRIAFLYPTRFPRRTLAYIIVYALVIFPVLTLLAYVPLQGSALPAQTVLRGGGYDVLGECRAPLFFELDNSTQRSEHNITGYPGSARVVSFITYGVPGGTCSNLNSQAPPKLLGANSTFVSRSKIPVSSALEGKTGAEAWALLDSSRPGAIPIIADYTTVVWIWEKGLGGKVEVVDEQGNAVKLEIVAILHDSIFQGSAFVSEKNLRALYPTLSHTDTFLFELSGPASAARTCDDLNSAFSDYGMVARPVRDIVTEFIAVDLAYVSMLQAMMFSGVLIGALGFSAKVSREAIERAHELGVMRAIGFRRGVLGGLLLGENLFIFLLGFATALVSALVASLAFLGMVVPLAETGLLLLVLLAVIVAATAVPAGRAMKRSVTENVRARE